MSLFCLLWVPLLLFFWLSLVSKEKSGAVPFWALVLGTLAALIHYFAGYVIKASGFALSRWFFALIDIIIIPAVLPFLAWFLLSFFRQIDEKAEPADNSIHGDGPVYTKTNNYEGSNDDEPTSYLIADHPNNRKEQKFEVKLSYGTIVKTFTIDYSAITSWE